MMRAQDGGLVDAIEPNVQRYREEAHTVSEVLFGRMNDVVVFK